MQGVQDCFAEQSAERSRPRVAVIGGGIAGLSAAWELQQRSVSDIVVLEAGDRWGGKIVTESFSVRDGDRQAPGRFVVDAGPESFITRKPGAWRLAQELGLGDRIVDPGSETRNIYVLHNGRPVLVPLSPAAFVRSKLLTWRGKLRLLAEPFIAPRRDDGDETLADFAARRLGREALERFLGPILGGIYNTDPEQQSIMVASPVMREMEREHGSLVRGTLARGRAKAQARREAAARGETLSPAFIAFPDGAQTLVDALVAQLDAEMRLGAPVARVQQGGGGYRVRLASGADVAADAVIVATPANTAAKLLAGAAPGAADLLAGIRHSGLGTLSLAYRAADLELGFAISGLMIPRREKRRIDAVTFTSTKFPQRVPPGYALLRVFFGGGAPELLEMDEAALVQAVTDELHSLLGIEAAPLGWQMSRWPNAYPQAEVGHLARVAAIEAALPPGLYVTGSAYRGVGVPDCIAQGRETARAAAERLAVAATAGLIS